MLTKESQEGRTDTLMVSMAVPASVSGTHILVQSAVSPGGKCLVIFLKTWRWLVLPEVVPWVPKEMTKTLHKTHRQQFSRYWTLSNSRQWSLKHKNQVRCLKITSADSPERLSKLWCKQGCVGSQHLGEGAKNWDLEQLDLMAQSTREDRATERYGRVLGSPLGRLTQSGVLTEVNKPAVAREQATQNNWNGAYFFFRGETRPCFYHTDWRSLAFCWY